MRQRMGKASAKKVGVNGTLSIMQKRINTTKVIPKLMSDEIFFEKRKRYFGTFTFENIEALSIREDIPDEVASLKYEKTMFPQKRYIV
jgi:hypothetical protein